MAVGRINGVAALTGFYCKTMYGRFAGTKKSGRKAGFHCSVIFCRKSLCFCELLK